MSFDAKGLLEVNRALIAQAARVFKLCPRAFNLRRIVLQLRGVGIHQQTPATAIHNQRRAIRHLQHLFPQTDDRGDAQTFCQNRAVRSRRAQCRTNSLNRFCIQPRRFGRRQVCGNQNARRNRNRMRNAEQCLQYLIGHSAHIGRAGTQVFVRKRVIVCGNMLRRVKDCSRGILMLFKNCAPRRCLQRVVLEHQNLRIKNFRLAPCPL